MDNTDQENPRKEQARQLLAQLDTQIALNRARRESLSGRRNTGRLLGVLLLLAIVAVMMWMLFWASSSLPEAKNSANQTTREQAP